MPAEVTHRGTWRVFADAVDLADAASELIAELARSCITKRGSFHIALAGGQTPRLLYQRLRHLQTDWRAWQLYFGDERCLPAGDEQRNDAMARAAWLDHIAHAHVHPIAAERGPDAAAAAYASKLARLDGLDICLLGLGEDGHTASLFPGQSLGEAPDAPLALPVRDAPKPPPERVTLSMRALNQSRQALVMVDGASKRQAVADWRAGKDLPVSRLAPREALQVFVTRAAMPAVPAG